VERLREREQQMAMSINDTPRLQNNIALTMGVCTENLIRVDDVMESPKLAE
jgi:hypothetical protein